MITVYGLHKWRKNWLIHGWWCQCESRVLKRALHTGWTFTFLHKGCILRKTDTHHHAASCHPPETAARCISGRYCQNQCFKVTMTNLWLCPQSTLVQLYQISGPPDMYNMLICWSLQKLRSEIETQPEFFATLPSLSRAFRRECVVHSQP